MIDELKAILRARRAGLLRLRAARNAVRLECPPGVCGLCCSSMGGGVVVTKREAQRLPRGSLDSKRKVIFLKSVDGVCAQVSGATCNCYDQRPRGCREYPWYSVNGKLNYDSGCPGIRFDSNEHPAASELTDIHAFLPFKSKRLKSVLIWILRRW